MAKNYCERNHSTLCTSSAQQPVYPGNRLANFPAEPQIPVPPNGRAQTPYRPTIPPPDDDDEEDEPPPPVVVPSVVPYIYPPFYSIDNDALNLYIIRLYLLRLP
ncbi:hypothetical protein LENED_005160 [Lentinula edodes]|uniref:Uncharacterized protein n=1 Tax=Lentinula edodes TaxID=5353 RepID=A0A1Q3E8N1_LENED|nr:hypothetical protein LENED_005160 [Lentinula edodes]